MKEGDREDATNKQTNTRRERKRRRGKGRETNDGGERVCVGCWV